MLAKRRPLANKQVCPEHREDGLWLKFSFYQRGGLLLKGPSLGCESHYSLQGGHEQFYRVMRQQNYSRVQCPYHVITRWACLLEASTLCILSPRAISISLVCPSMNQSSLQILLIFGSSFENDLYQALTTEWARIIGHFASPIDLSMGLGIDRSARLTRPSHGPSDPEMRPTPTIHVSTSTYRQHSAKTPALQQ